MARSSNSSACACGESARTRATSASVKGAEKTRRVAGLTGAAAAMRRLLRREVNEVVRHAIKPIIPATIAKKMTSGAAEEVGRLDEVKTCPGVCPSGCGDTPRGKST